MSIYRSREHWMERANESNQNHRAFYNRKEGVQDDGNDGTPDHGLEEGEDDPDAPDNEQENNHDPKDGVD